jgi:TRAP-type transport system periplasmic protein
MKKLLMVLLLFVVFIPFAHAVASKPIEMKLGHFAADSYPGNLASKMFAEAVEKRTNGAIKVTIYPNNALGAPPEVLEQNILRRGGHDPANARSTGQMFQKIQLHHASIISAS